MAVWYYLRLALQSWAEENQESLQLQREHEAKLDYVKFYENHSPKKNVKEKISNNNDKDGHGGKCL